MKEVNFIPLDPLLHSELRLSVMSILMMFDKADFQYIKEQTGATSGNISVQLDKLAEAEYIRVNKLFKGKRPCTECEITEKGRDAFNNYITALKSYLPK